ncbi:putative galactose-1-phosphate uridylyltransferase [Colletotrichum sublineola]|uniref:Galactose-1-phosphate uridylyltransferase n=1 Tax=Colletotrichum sublineola TaxID=1173701 RepID=A0A066XYM9_COLSU|nr:putative galactose-1-phosphate uridylyltransferase [Colletotrichum sublineola]
MPEKILDDISHRRYNPLKDTWLLVSPHRTKRPWQAVGDSNPDYKNTFVFVNDYSAVKEEQAEYKPEAETNGIRLDLASSLLRAEAATGKCYVLTFSEKHHVTLADMTTQEIAPVIDVWTHIYASHLSPSNPLSKVAAALEIPAPTPESTVTPPKHSLRYMQIFENKGAAMGCSNPHPHCQIWTTSTMPEEPGTELKQMAKYRDQHAGRHLLGDYVKVELEKKERTVFENKHFLVIVPWWGVWPFEVLVLPKRHVRALVDLSAEERLQFAEAIQEVARRYDNLFETHFPYSSGIHQAPLDATEEEAENSYLHMHFYPPLLRSATVRKFLVGYEMMAEPQRDITPEQAAARLRATGGELYRKVIQ